jgi:hypothetical protein
MGPSSVVTVAPCLLMCVANWRYGFSSFSLVSLQTYMGMIKQ